MTTKKTKRMGRPPKAKAEKQCKAVTARLTPADHARLVADAKKAGMPKAVYLVKCWKNRRA